MRAVLAFLALAACASAPPVEAPRPAFADGWIEAVAIVRDLDRTEAFFTDVAGYERIGDGATPRAVLDAWGLGEDATGEERLLAEPGEQRGFVRLVSLSGAGEAGEIRPAAGFQDTGAIAGLNVRVIDIDAAYARMEAAGWRPFAPVVRFSVEAFAVAEAIFRGPDGLVIGLIERERPPLGPEWRMADGELSRPNNAFVVAADLGRALAFYEGELGWSVFLRDEGPAAPPGPNLYGWPHDYVSGVRRSVAWTHPAGGGEGSVALMALSAEGRDLSARSAPPNLGWSALRLWRPAPADGQVSAPHRLSPYGCVTLSTQIDPEGVRLETLSPATGCEGAPADG